MISKVFLPICLAVTLTGIVLTGCSRQSSDSGPSTSGPPADATVPYDPYITGIVTAIGPGRTLRVEETPGMAQGGEKAQLRVPDSVRIVERGGAEKTFADLREGTKVNVWITGPVAESYPVQATASGIEIVAAPPSGPGEHTVSYTGYGPVRAGMTVAEAEQALGAKLPLLGPSMEPCHYVSIDGKREVAFMVIDGKIARVDIERESKVKTAQGAGIGDSEDRIRSLYPGFIEKQPHKYTDGNYLIVRAPADTNFRIIFETDGKNVTDFRAGRMPEVRWVEGCS